MSARVVCECVRRTFTMDDCPAHGPFATASRRLELEGEVERLRERVASLMLEEPSKTQGLYAAIDELQEAHDRERQRTRSGVRTPAPGFENAYVAGNVHAAVCAERDSRQAAIDTALSWMRNSAYVGGPSERDAWRKALEVLGPFETQHIGATAFQQIQSSKGEN